MVDLSFFHHRKKNNPSHLKLHHRQIASSYSRVGRLEPKKGKEKNEGK
jgi:hypothetical protein